MQLTIVIPTYNEAENLPGLVSAIFSLPIPEVYILVVDDNSPDGTWKVALELERQCPERFHAIVRPGKLGLGSAYLLGFHHALAMGSQAIAQMDADFSHSPHRLPQLLQTLEESDVVIGSRYVPGGGVDKRWPLWRKALSAFGNYYARSILHLPVKDATGGFRIWRRETLEGMPLERIGSNGYAFQIEMIYVAHRLGYTLSEVPIHFAERGRGNSKMSLAIQIEAAWRVWQFRFKYQDLAPPS